MKQVLIRQGGVVVEDVPPPRTEVGHVLVRVEHSCISVGTEMSGVRTSSLPLWKRAIKSPQDVRKVIDRVRSTGVSETRDLVRRKLLTAYPLGYSASGTVISVGDGVTVCEVGDRVSCAGAQSAFHAEIISVPENLVARVPSELSGKNASTVTLGAIALQGIRRATPTLGETFLVIGLGVLGQLTQRMLGANGVKVIGVDLARERVTRAMETGMAHGVTPDDGDVVEQVYRLTDGYGADAVIITAASPANDIISTAFKACRKKGRVVLVGDVGLDIDREDIYAKELDFYISTSYGPGRYDRAYEEHGVDYPLAYVRWTETRNMEAYLGLIADKRIEISDLISVEYSIDDAPAAYRALENGDSAPLAVVLSYPVGGPESTKHRTPSVTNPRYTESHPSGDRVRLGVIGAGGFATGTLLPIIAKHPKHFAIMSIATRHGVSATNVARQFNAKAATTDAGAVLTDPDVDAVLIATRHNTHGSLVLRALEAGKHVFVEKPLCLTAEELDLIEAFYGKNDGPVPILLTGFNRRFSRYAQAVDRIAQNRAAPLIVNYRVNAGYLPAESWVHGEEGGGRNLGEACHFYDFFTFLARARVAQVQALSIKSPTRHYGSTDNFTAQVAFDEGSVASLTYTALGAKSHPKERIDVYCDGCVSSIDDFVSYTDTNGKGFNTSNAQKGHEEELLAFANAVCNGGDWPIPLWQQVQATRIALEVERQIRRGGSGEEAELGGVR